MKKNDLLNAMRLLQDYCKAVHDCESCLIGDECCNSFDGVMPEDWDLGDEKVEH